MKKPPHIQPRAEVLVADDDATNRLVLKRLLERAGLTVTEAVHGGVVLDMLRERRFDLLLLNVTMPVVDGMKVLAEIRRNPDPWISRLPVIVVTAHAMEGDRERILQSGADAYVSKPIELAGLMDQVERALGLKAGLHLLRQEHPLAG